MNKRLEELEKLPDNQGWNEYDYLRNEALYYAKRGRDKLPELERAFYEAISQIKWESNRIARVGRIDELLNAIIAYPVALRTAMDQNDIANEHLHRAETIKRIELMEKKGKK